MSGTDVRRAIDAVWRIESAKIIAVVARMLRDVGQAEELAQDALVAALGCTTFVLLRLWTPLPGGLSGLLACVLIFVLRVLSIRYDWKTSPLRLRAVGRPGQDPKAN